MLNKIIPNQKIIKFYVSFIFLCALAGVGSALFSLATDKAYEWCMQIYKYCHYWMLVYTPLLFILIVYLLKKYFPYAGGSGLPQGYALDVFETEVLHSTYSLKTMTGKVILTFLSILGGASLGREGPTIQICASIFASLKNISLERKKLLIRIGSGVGVATAFNAPLGGIIFAIEEYIKHSDHKMNILLLVGIGVAGYFTVVVSGNYSYMGDIDVSTLFYSWQGILISILAGVILGLTGALFTWLIVFVSAPNNSWFSKWRKQNSILCAGIFGLLVAALGLLSDGYSFGNGAITTKEVLNHTSNLPWYFTLVKSIGAIFSVSGGVPGGYFSTSLSIGAGVMDLVHRLLPVIPVQQYYLLGMVGFLAAITGAPITAVAMIMSIVSDTQHFTLPLIITAVISSYIASLFGDSVYHQQVLIYIDKEKYHKTR